MDAGEAADGLHEDAVGLVGVGAPAGEAAEVGVARGAEAQAGEGELGLFPGVGRVVDGVLHFVLELRPAVRAGGVLGGGDGRCAGGCREH